MFNQVTLIGRVVHDIKLEDTKSGIHYVSNSIAVQRRYDKNKTDFFNFTIWRNSADYFANYSKKGDLIMISGRLETNSYKDSNNENKYSTQVIAEQIEVLKSSKEKAEVEEQETTRSFDEIKQKVIEEIEEEKKKETKLSDEDNNVPWDLDL